jgi:hypothetical protein
MGAGGLRSTRRQKLRCSTIRESALHQMRKCMADEIHGRRSALTSTGGFMPKLSLDLKFAWPGEGDRLLAESDDWEKAAAFSRDPSSRAAHIWSGYMRAGGALIDACERDPSDRHHLIYPIMFCYRHGLEVAMKWIVGRYGPSAGVPKPNHNLWDLWLCCKKIIIEIAGDSESKSLANVETVI